MNPLFTRKQFVSALIEVISLGVSHNKLEDAETVLGVVRNLRPRLGELDTFEAWIAIKRGHWHDAIRTLHKLDGTTRNWALGKALMAFCQFAIGDPGWAISANDVLETNPTGDAANLVRLLMGKESANEPEAPAPSTTFADYDPHLLQQSAYLRA